MRMYVNNFHDCILGRSKGCEICHREDYGTVSLDENTPSFLVEHFHDPIYHLKKFHKINEFQRLQKEKLFNYLVNKVIWLILYFKLPTVFVLAYPK